MMLAPENTSVEIIQEKSAEEVRGADTLKGALIICFEDAINQGLPPQNALAAILNFAAEECGRLLYAAQ